MFAYTMTRIRIFAFLLALALLHPAPVRAESANAGSLPHVTTCIDREELASVMQAEGGAQPLETQIAIMQIVKREADSRGLTICALTRLTWFVSVRHYADAHPTSWTAAQFRNPHDWALEMAEAVLMGEYEDMTQGMRHWDGSADGMHLIFRP